MQCLRYVVIISGILALTAKASAESKSYNITRYDVWTYALNDGSVNTYIRAYEGSQVRLFLLFRPDTSKVSGTFNRSAGYFAVNAPERYYDRYLEVFRQEGVATVSGSFGAGNFPTLSFFSVNSPPGATPTDMTSDNLMALLEKLEKEARDAKEESSREKGE